MLENPIANDQTLPLTQPTPESPKRSGGLSVGRLLLVGVLAFLVATATGRVELGGAIGAVRDAIGAKSAATSTSSSATTTDSAAVAAVKDVITRANQAQVQALAKSDPTLMRDTATASYYQELLTINRDLANAGVASIELTKLDWGDVSVTGNSATATTYETWRTNYTDGSTDMRTDRNEYTLVQQSGAWKIQTDVQPDSQLISPSTGIGTPPAQPGTPASTSSTSSNWSGYIANGGTFTSVSGTWVVPTVSAASAGADATWVGIGGLNSNDLIQAGTQATVTGNGGVTYEAWIETLPQSSRPISLAVTAGDSVTVTLTKKSGSSWSIAMKNNTTGATYDTTVTYMSSLSSAEWVQEAPSAGRGVIPLDDFGTLKFTAASAVKDGTSQNLTSLGAKAISMINGRGEVLAQPSTIGNDGSSFTVTRTSAQSTTRGAGGNPFRRGGP